MKILADCNNKSRLITLGPLSALILHDTLCFPLQAEAIISKYLTHQGNSLGTAELNSIGGANLCALNVSVIQNISKNSIR